MRLDRQQLAPSIGVPNARAAIPIATRSENLNNETNKNKNFAGNANLDRAMPKHALCRASCRPSRRAVLTIAGAGLASMLVAGRARAQLPSKPLTLGLTPVFLTNDLELLAALRAYFEKALGRSIKLVLRRTYEEITTLLVSESTRCGMDMRLSLRHIPRPPRSTRRPGLARQAALPVLHYRRQGSCPYFAE